MSGIEITGAATAAVEVDADLAGPAHRQRYSRQSRRRAGPSSRGERRHLAQRIHAQWFGEPSNRVVGGGDSAATFMANVFLGISPDMFAGSE